jgi:hypothetical protein
MGKTAGKGMCLYRLADGWTAEKGSWLTLQLEGRPCLSQSPKGAAGKVDGVMGGLEGS